MERSFWLTSGSLQIPCVVSEPDFGSIRRVVLGVHGLGGSAEDQIQASIAEEMEMFYSACLRFDFPSHGQSPHEEFTLAGCRQTLMAVARYIRETYPDVENLCIFASGFGAYVTLVCLNDLLELPGRVKLVVQTPSVLMHDTLLRMCRLSAPTLQAMEQTVLRAPRPIQITYGLYQELIRNIALTPHPIPMLILHSQDNEYIRWTDIQQFHRVNEDSRLVVIPGTSHRFLEDGAWDMVLDLTRDWFEFEQVLLDCE